MFMLQSGRAGEKGISSVYIGIYIFIYMYILGFAQLKEFGCSFLKLIDAHFYMIIKYLDVVF